ncbi:MAG: (2Fe-2S)-binding protein [Tissierellia bacterium]|nr:(2Fe-2S)-binding protein [Tissierellia bacterium]
MKHDDIVCIKNNVNYISIRKAMTKGARTVEEVREITGACGECEGCKENLGWILSSVCGCAKASLETVVNAVKNGANTVEKIGEITGAGTKCGNCKGLIQNVIDLGR